MKNMLLGLAAFVSPLALAAPAHALTFVIDTGATSVDVTSNNASCIFGSCTFSAGLAALPASFDLDVGETFTFDFANFNVSPGFGFGNAMVDAVLAFSNPGGGASTSGSANYIRAGGIFTPGVLTGSLNWTDSTQTVSLGNGAQYTVSFANLAGFALGGAATSTVSVTLDAVPEAGTWAMMIIGFGAIGWAMRRRRSNVNVAVSYA